MKTLKFIPIAFLVMLHANVLPIVTHGQALKIGVVAVYEGNESITKLEWVRSRFDPAFEDQKNCLGLDYSLLPDVEMYQIDNAISADQAIVRRLSDEFKLLKYVVVIAFPKDIDSSNPYVSIRVIDIEEVKSIVTLDPLIYDTRAERFQEEYRYISAGKQVVEELWCAIESCEPKFLNIGSKDSFIGSVAVNRGDSSRWVIDFSTVEDFGTVSKKASEIDLKVSLANSKNPGESILQLYPGELNIIGPKKNIAPGIDAKLIWDITKDISSCKIRAHGTHKALFQDNLEVKLEARRVHKSFQKRNRLLALGAAIVGGGILLLKHSGPDGGEGFVDPPVSPTTGN